MFKQTRTTFRGIVQAAAISTSMICVAASPAAAQSYREVSLVSDTAAGHGKNVDPNLVNPWGLAALGTNPWWVSDNGTGKSTLYDGQGNIQSLVVAIPPSASAPPGSTGNPTGIVANDTTDFGGAAFIFDSEDGSISAWSGAPSAVIKVDRGIAAVYKGLTMGQMGGVNLLYAANFRTGTVDVFDTNFNPVALGAGAFVDPRVPNGFAPFNVQNINNDIYVTYAKQDASKKDEQDGQGLGFVTAFDSSGRLRMRLQHGPFMNAPWGVAVAPSNFGKFSNDILVGQFGSGATIAFDHSSGKVQGALTNAAGRPFVVPGLWALRFGQGGSAGPTNWLYFTAGTGGESHGLFGYFVAQ